MFTVAVNQNAQGGGRQASGLTDQAWEHEGRKLGAIPPSNHDCKKKAWMAPRSQLQG